MPTEKELKRVNPRTATVNRVKAIKDKLPSNYRAIILSNYPEYNTAAGYSLISNVITGRTADNTVTEILEKIADGKLHLKAA